MPKPFFDHLNMLRQRLLKKARDPDLTPLQSKDSPSIDAIIRYDVFDLPSVWILAVTCSFRIANGLVVRTYFSPDEYWQSLEVAYDIVFGTPPDNSLTWEWLPGARIRGALHPMLFATLYETLRVLGLDSRVAVAYGPRVLQGLAAGLADYFTYLLARHQGGKDNPAFGMATLFCQLSSWFCFYCGVRTFSDSMAWPFCCAGLALWPQSYSSAQPWRRPVAIMCFVIAVALRPPVAPAFAAYIVWQTFQLGLGERCDQVQRSTSWDFPPVARFLLGEVLPIGTIALMACAVVDYAFYGEWYVSYPLCIRSSFLFIVYPTG